MSDALVILSLQTRLKKKIVDARSKMRKNFHIRNREVEETLSKTADFGCNEKYDKLELRNRCLGNTSQTKVVTQKL